MVLGRFGSIMGSAGVLIEAHSRHCKSGINVLPSGLLDTCYTSCLQSLANSTSLELLLYKDDSKVRLWLFVDITNSILRSYVSMLSLSMSSLLLLCWWLLLFLPLLLFFMASVAVAVQLQMQLM